MTKKIAVIGKNGQLAWELSQLKTECSLVFFGRGDIDITSITDIESKLSNYSFDAIINASAYTAVDNAETEQEIAYLINAESVKNLARFCLKHHLHLTHISTDYVFGGDKGSPYLPNDEYNPQSVYGASKMEGEKNINEIIPHNSCTIRTSWVYSSYGNNFVKTMLRLMNEKDELSVIDDQIGSPTHARDLAKAALHSAVYKISDTYHWTDEGVCSWYDFAKCIQKLALNYGVIEKQIPISPISSSEYQTPAKRPTYSVLDKKNSRIAFSSLQVSHWVDNLENFIKNFKSES